MFIALDLETTGLEPRKDKIIEIAAVKIKPDGTIVEEFHSVLNPGVPVPHIITHLTGITNEDVKDAPTLNELKPQIAAFMGELPILGHSIGFDIDFLNANGLAENAMALDTFRLAQTLLPKEASYSLEILSEKYRLPHPNKHRALDDTRVAIELYKLLLQKIREIPEKHGGEIRAVLGKSHWSWKEIFLEFLGNAIAPDSATSDHPRERRSASASASASALEPSVPGSAALRETLFENLTVGRSALIESSDYTATDLALAAVHMAEQTGEHVVIVTPHPERIPSDPQVAHLEHPGRYLSRKHFEAFLNQTSFTNTETRLAIKVLLWLDETATGLKSELSIGDEEQNVWAGISELHSLAADMAPDPESFYGKAFKNARYTNVLVIHPTVLLENLVRKATLLPDKAHLVVDQIDEFEDAMLRSFTNTFALDQFTHGVPAILADRFAMLFGLLGMLVEKFAENDPGNQYPGHRQLTLKPHHFSGPEGAKIRDLLDSMDADLGQAAPYVRLQWTALKKALDLKPGILTWLTLNARENLLLKACPENPRHILSQSLWSARKSLQGLTRFGGLNGTFAFLKKRLALPEQLKENFLPLHAPLPSMNVSLHTDLPNVKIPANVTETVKLIETILGEHAEQGAVFLLTNSIKAAEELHEKLSARLKESSRNILTQGISGGLGKITQRYENAPEQALLIGTDRLLDVILDSPEVVRMDTVLLHRIPFKFPWHPLLQNECDQMGHSFMEYGVPIALLALKKVLSELKTRTSVTCLHVLDPRIENYDGAFLPPLTNS